MYYIQKLLEEFCEDYMLYKENTKQNIQFDPLLSCFNSVEEETVNWNAALMFKLI